MRVIRPGSCKNREQALAPTISGNSDANNPGLEHKQHRHPIPCYTAKFHPLAEQNNEEVCWEDDRLHIKLTNKAMHVSEALPPLLLLSSPAGNICPPNHFSCTCTTSS